jgi:radical SAM protein
MESAANHATDRVPARLRQLRYDVATRPFLVLLELTRACELACRHCRAEAIPQGEPGDLTTAEVEQLLSDLASLGPPRPIVVLTGGDPLQRDDLARIVEEGAQAGLAMAVAPAGTPRANRARFAELRRAGARTVSLSLDAGDAGVHDAFRGVAHSFEWTVAAFHAAKAAGLRVQVNTTVSGDTVQELPALARLMAELGADLWSVFFLVPTGRGRLLQPLSATETEDVLAFLHDVAAVVPLKTTEAPAFRRVVLTREEGRRAPATGPLYDALHHRLADTWPAGAHALSRTTRSTPSRRRAPLVVGDGRGVVFISHRGDVQPSGFLPLVVGNVRVTPLPDLYASSTVLRALRDPGRLTGRCGGCEYRSACGGSRAQAFAHDGDPFGEDPTCAYTPGSPYPLAGA